MTVYSLDFLCDRMLNAQNAGVSKQGTLPSTAIEQTAMSIGASRRTSSSSSSNSGGKMGKRPGKRPGRKPSKIDEHAKLERSRQSARECRARKKLRYQYLEELVVNREKAVYALRDELETYKAWCAQTDQGELPSELREKVTMEAEATSAAAILPGSPGVSAGEILDFSSEFGREVADVSCKEDT